VKLEKGKIVLIVLGITAAGVVAYAFVPEVRNFVSKISGGKIGGSGNKHAKSFAVMPRGPTLPPRAQASMHSQETLAPGGAGRNTLTGVINTNKFSGRVLNRFGR
jgi:hypothetical protein